MAGRTLIGRRVRARGLAGLAAALTLGVVASGCGSSSSTAGSGGGSPQSSSAAGAVAATIEVYPQTYTSWLAVLAQAGGFFKKNGLNATIVPVAGGGPVAMAGLANGSADIAMADLSIAGPLLEKGIGLQVVSGAAFADWTLVGPPASSASGFPNAIKPFNGKTIGVIVVGGSAYYYMKTLAAAAKINVTYAAFGAPVVNAVSALTTHRVDGEVVNPDVGNYLQRSHQGRILYNFSDPADLKSAGPPLASLAGQPNDWMVARTGWIHAHPEAVKRFQLAMEQAEVWVHDPAHLDRVISLLQQTDELPKYDSGAVSRTAVQALLPSLVAYLPPTTPAAYMQFWMKAGLLSHTIPTDKWVSPTMPTSEAQVLAAAHQGGSSS